MSLPPEFDVFLDISFKSLNLFSFVLGAIWGLSTGWFRYKNWWTIIAYFAIVAFIYANSEAISNYKPTKFDVNNIDRNSLNHHY